MSLLVDYEFEADFRMLALFHKLLVWQGLAKAVFNFHFLIYLFTFLCVNICMPQHMCRDLRTTLDGSSLPLQCAWEGSNLGHQPWWPAPWVGCAWTEKNHHGESEWKDETHRGQGDSSIRCPVLMKTRASVVLLWPYCAGNQPQRSGWGHGEGQKEAAAGPWRPLLNWIDPKLTPPLAFSVPGAKNLFPCLLREFKLSFPFLELKS